MCGGSFLGRSLRYRLNVYWKPEGHCGKRKPFCRKEADAGIHPWDYVKPGIAIAAFAVGLIFVLFKFDAVSKVGGVLFNAVSSFILGLFIAYILNCVFESV